MIKKFKFFNRKIDRQTIPPVVKPELDWLSNPGIIYYDNGQKSVEYWNLTDFKWHREDGPAYQQWYENGQKMLERWFLNGKSHREDGPAYQRWWDNGQKSSESWYLNDKYHREDGPAEQDWNLNGRKSSEMWYLNGKQHREDGPANTVTRLSPSVYNRFIFKEEWYLHDKQYTTKEKWIEGLKNIGSPHYDEQQMLLNMEKYNL